MNKNKKVLKKLYPLIVEYKIHRGYDELLKSFISKVLSDGNLAYSFFKVEKPNTPNEYSNFLQNSQVLGLAKKFNVSLK